MFFSVFFYLIFVKICTAHECCKFIENSDTDLIQCLNTSLTMQVDNRKHINIGPRFSLLMLTRITSEIYSYATYSLLIQSIYSDINGYQHLPIYPDSLQNDYLLYRKLIPILESLESYPDSDYIVWIDADAVILHMDYRLELLIAKYPQAHLLISQDVSSLANSGMMVIKNSKWSINFLKLWWSYRHNVGTDQLGFDAAYENYQKNNGNMKRIEILSPYVLNSEAPPMTKHTPDRPVLHLAMESNEYRSNVFKSLSQQICNNINHNNNHNLEISSQDLLLKAIEVYEPIALNILKSLEEDLLLFINNDNIDTNEEIKTELYMNLLKLQEKWTSDRVKELRVMTSKYVYAYTNYYNNHIIDIQIRSHKAASRLSILLLQQATELYYDNICTYNALDTIALLRLTTTSHLPEILKLSSELSYELFLIFNTSNVKNDNVYEVQEHIRCSLEILREIVSPHQVQLVNEMLYDLSLQS